MRQLQAVTIVTIAARQSTRLTFPSRSPQPSYPIHLTQLNLKKNKFQCQEGRPFSGTGNESAGYLRGVSVGGIRAGLERIPVIFVIGTWDFFVIDLVQRSFCPGEVYGRASVLCDKG